MGQKDYFKQMLVKDVGSNTKLSKGNTNIYLFRMKNKNLHLNRV